MHPTSIRRSGITLGTIVAALLTFFTMAAPRFYDSFTLTSQIISAVHDPLHPISMKADRVALVGARQ